ncbi:hypothetical protein OF83DRAFT_1080795 [Amylostereum chailletii]|nr:hypothetical protein OF83DRAFT_1080795 [Amylostereum chailletii]
MTPPKTDDTFPSRHKRVRRDALPRTLLTVLRISIGNHFFFGTRGHVTYLAGSAGLACTNTSDGGDSGGWRHNMAVTKTETNQQTSHHFLSAEELRGVGASKGLHGLRQVALSDPRVTYRRVYPLMCGMWCVSNSHAREFFKDLQAPFFDEAQRGGWNRGSGEEVPQSCTRIGSNRTYMQYIVSSAAEGERKREESGIDTDEGGGKSARGGAEVVSMIFEEWAVGFAWEIDR